MNKSVRFGKFLKFHQPPDMKMSFWLKGNGIKLFLTFHKKNLDHFIYGIGIEGNDYISTSKVSNGKEYHTYLDCMMEAGEWEDLYYSIICADKHKLERQRVSWLEQLNLIESTGYHSEIYKDTKEHDRFIQQYNQNVEALEKLNKVKVKLKYPEEQIIFF